MNQSNLLYASLKLMFFILLKVLMLIKKKKALDKLAFAIQLSHNQMVEASLPFHHENLSSQKFGFLRSFHSKMTGMRGIIIYIYIYRQ